MYILTTRNTKKKEWNYRNAHGTNKIKISFTAAEIQVPRDRARSFQPVLVPKRHNIIEGLGNIIISFYDKGVSAANIDEQIRDMYDLEVISRYYF